MKSLNGFEFVLGSISQSTPKTSAIFFEVKTSSGLHSAFILPLSSKNM